MRRGETIERSDGFITEQVCNRVSQVAGSDRVEAPLYADQRRQPFVEALKQGGVAQIGHRCVMRPGEGRALSKGNSTLAPGKDRQAMTPDRVDQARLDRSF